MDFYKFHSKPKTLKGYEESDNIVPSRILDILRNKGAYFLTQKQVEKLAQHADLALEYARKIREPFPAGEKAIATDARSSYYYANDVLDDRFPEGENAISKHSSYAYYYAVDIINGPWPKGEPAILKSALDAYDYALKVVKGPWPKGEDVIAKDPEYAIPYAISVLKKRFLKAEPAIARSKYKHQYEEHFKIKL